MKMVDDHSIQVNDSPIAWGLLSLLLVLAPLLPQHIYPGFAFFFRSSLILLLGLSLYQTGASVWLARLHNSPLIAPAYAMIALLMAGLWITPDIYRAKEKLIIAIAIFVFYGLILVSPLSDRIRKILLWSLALGGLLTAVHGLTIQWLGHADAIAALKDSAAYPDDMRHEMILSLEANRAMGRFGNPNQLAGYLLLALWPSWMLWKQSRSFRVRALSGCFMALLTIGIYRTYSRSGLVVLLATGLLILGYELHCRGFRLSWKKIAWIAVAGLSVVTITVISIPSGFFGGRLLTISTIVARTHFFRGALLIIQQHPWLGVGPEGFESFYCSVLRPGDLEAHYVHNILLESAVEGGILGTTIFFWILLAVFRSFWREWHTRPNYRIEVFSAMGACLTLLLFSLVDFHNNLMDMWLIPIVLIGLLHKRKTPALTIRRTRGLVSVLMITLATAWVLLVLCRYWNDVARTDGRFYALEGKKFEARQAYERAVLYDRTDAESWRNLGLLWAEIPNPASQTRRLECIQQAIRWSPHRASLRADYADSLFTLGYMDRALEEMLQAQRLFPARPMYYERAAAIYQFLNRNEEAEQQRKKAESIQKEIEANRI